MRVLTVGNMYPPHHTGGYELVWHSTVAALRKAGHSVRVLTSDHRESEPRSGIDEDPDVDRGLRWYWRDDGFPAIPRSELLELERHNRSKLLTEIADHEPDVILWGPMGGMSMSLLTGAAQAGVPGLAMVIDEWLVYGPLVDGFYRWTHEFGPVGRLRARSSGLRRPWRPETAINRIVYGSSVLQSNAERALGSGARGEVVTAGADLGLFEPVDPPAWSGRLLCVGRLDPRKGFAVAIEALARLPEARLLIATAGHSEHERELEQLAEQLGVSKRMRIARPARAEMPATFAAADAVLFPVQWEEPWGLVPLEAMAVGRPVVASGTGGSAEFLSDRENCLIYEERDDAEELAAAVSRLGDDPGLRHTLIEGGRRTATEHSAARFEAALVERLSELA